MESWSRLVTPDVALRQPAGAEPECISFLLAVTEFEREGNEANNIPFWGSIGNNLNDASKIAPRVPIEPV